MSNVTRAVRIAAEAHGLQTRKGSTEPYLYHCIRVADMVRENGEEEWVQMLAILHDVVEDTEWSFDDVYDALLNSNMNETTGDIRSSKVIRALPALTKDPGKDKVAAVNKLDDDSIPVGAIIVKMADRIDNLRPDDYFDARWRKKQLPSTERLLEIAKERGADYSLLFEQLSKRVEEIKAEEL